MTLTAILMAGGLSRRMGRDKALMPISGGLLFQRQLALLREMQPEVLWISARARPDWCPPEIEVVIDAPPSRGPLSGLAAALAKLKTSHLLALAVDLPRMTIQPLQKLRTMAQPGCGVVPAQDREAEPLCAIYPREAAPLAEAALAGEDVSMKSFIRVLQQRGLVRIIPLDAPDRPFFHNMNSPADLADGVVPSAFPWNPTHK